jgi:hypothetical protein
MRGFHVPRRGHPFPHLFSERAKEAFTVGLIIIIIIACYYLYSVPIHSGMAALLGLLNPENAGTMIF